LESVQTIAKSVLFFIFSSSIVTKLILLQAVFRIRIRKFLGLPDPDPLERGTDPDPSNLQAKIVRKTFNFAVWDFFATFYL
jgi:hypothetical protein